jgi:TonB family protein
MIARTLSRIAVVGALLAGSASAGLEAQARQRPFQSLDDGSVVFDTGNTSTVTVGPFPADVDGRGVLFVVSAMESLRSGYPATVRDGGIGGTVMVGMYVHWSGQIHNTRIDRSSGVESLDQAALLYASSMGFQQVPAGSPLTFAWVSVPIRFQVG